jgi:uncharacterized protein involved in exopolysaccharide biosynthesis
MARQTYAERLVQWNLLKQGLDANTADLAFLEAERGQFAALLANVTALDAQQEALKAQLQQTTQELDDTLARTTTLASRLRASLIGKYGAKNEKLEAFGIKAHRRRATAQPAA